MIKYYRSEKGKKVLIDDKDRWKIARPILVELLLLLVDYIHKKDEETK